VKNEVIKYNINKKLKQSKKYQHCLFLSEVILLVSSNNKVLEWLIDNIKEFNSDELYIASRNILSSFLKKNEFLKAINFYYKCLCFGKTKII